MNEMIKHRPDFAQQNEEQRTARERMALFPARAEVLYIAPDIWVVSVLRICALLFSCSPAIRAGPLSVQPIY